MACAVNKCCESHAWFADCAQEQHLQERQAGRRANMRRAACMLTAIFTVAPPAPAPSAPHVLDLPPIELSLAGGLPPLASSVS